MMLRILMILIGLSLSALAGGSAFAMPGNPVSGNPVDHGCHHLEDGALSSGIADHHVPQDKAVPSDCCTGAGACRMANCAAVAILSALFELNETAEAAAFLSAVMSPFKGQTVPPLLGPPRTSPV